MCLCRLRFVCQYKEYFTESVEEKNLSKDISLSDNTIYGDINTEQIQMGKMNFSKNLITLCARAVADYIKNNRETVEKIVTD